MKDFEIARYSPGIAQIYFKFRLTERATYSMIEDLFQETLKELKEKYLHETKGECYKSKEAKLNQKEKA